MDYTIKTDTQGEAALQSAIGKWVVENTTTNGETKEVVVPKTPTNQEMLQKWVDEKLSVEVQAVQSKAKADFQTKLDSLTAAELKQVKAIMESKNNK